MFESGLRSNIKELFPYPTAAAFASYENSSPPDDRLDHLLYAAESLVQLVGSVVLIEACEELKQNPNALALAQGLAKVEHGTAKLGLWLYCLERLLPMLSTSTVPELVKLTRSSGEWKGFCQDLRNLTSERNGLSHPWRRISDKTARALLPRIEAYFLGIAERLHFLCDYRLLAVESSKEGGKGNFVLRVRPLIGHHGVIPAPVELRVQTSLNAFDIVLIRVGEPATTALLLDPLYRSHGSLADLRESIYAFHRQVGNQFVYYGAGDPDLTHSEPAAKNLLDELRDPSSRERRRSLSLSDGERQALVDVGGTSSLGRTSRSGPWGVRARARSGERARTTHQPNVEVPPPPVETPPPEVEVARNDHDWVPNSADAGLVIPVAAPRQRARLSLRPWVGAFLVVLILGGVGATFRPQAALLGRILRGLGSHADPESIDGGGLGDGDGGRVDAAVDTLSVQTPRLEVDWVARESGTQAALLGIWGGKGGVRVAVGERGTILLSRDFGESWHARTVKDLPARQLYAVTGSASGVFFAVGGSGTVVRSVDGGETWFIKSVLGNSEILMGVWTDDGRTVFVCGDHGTLLRSADAGETWLAISITGGSLLRGIWGRSRTDLWATGWDGIVFHSEDGQHFRRQRAHPEAWLWDGYSDSQGGVFVVGQHGRILRSLNKGESWRPVITGEPSALTSIWGNDREDLWIAGQAGIFHSSDRGATWEPDKSGMLHESKRKLNHLWGSPDGELIAVGDGGTILYSYRKR